MTSGDGRGWLCTTGYYSPSLCHYVLHYAQTVPHLFLAHLSATYVYIAVSPTSGLVDPCVTSSVCIVWCKANIYCLLTYV